MDVVSVDVGTTTRVRLAVEHDDAAAPRRWFVKLPSSSWRARALVGLVRLPQQEVRFYQQLAPALTPSCPVALAASARPGRGFTLVLPDLDECAATTFPVTAELTVDEAAEVILTLAAIHSRGAQLVHTVPWLHGPSRRLEDGCGTVLSIPLVRRGLARADNAVPSELHRSVHRYARRRTAVMKELRCGSATLVHHDCHPGNLYWRAGKAGLLDWQLVRRGDGIGDVAYLLASSLRPDDRANNERALLAEYGTALSARGMSMQTNAVQRYRKHLTYALEAMLVTLAVGGFMADADARELVRRTAAAAVENESFAALEALR